MGNHQKPAKVMQTMRGRQTLRASHMSTCPVPPTPTPYLIQERLQDVAEAAVPHRKLLRRHRLQQAPACVWGGVGGVGGGGSGTSE
jgi:hypothetical protein